MEKSIEINRLEWAKVKEWVHQRFGKYPSVTTLLFIIGLQEIGILIDGLEKEEKEEVIHVGNCTVLGLGGYYKRLRTDIEGWPHFEPTSALDGLTAENQESVIKHYIIEYFKKEIEL